MENYKSNIAFATEIMFLVNVFVKTWKKGFSVENIWKTIFTLTLYNFVIGGMENYKSIIISIIECMFSRAAVGELLIVYLPQHYNAAQNKQLNLPCSHSFYQTFMGDQK